MSYEDISESMAAELTSSVGLQDDGGGMSESLADDLTDHEQYQAERDIPVSNDVEDTAQGELDREVEQEQTQQRQKKVPIQALHEERQKRQAREVELAALQQQMQQLMHQQQLAQQAQQEAAIPDFDEDPRGYIEAKEKQFVQALEQIQNGPAQQQQQVEQFQTLVHQESARLTPAVVEAEQRFMQQHSDYQQAFDHVQAAVDSQLRARYPGATEQQLQLAHKAELVGHVKNCQARGLDPCEAIYKSAQKLGYQPANKQRKEAPTSLSNVHGSSRAPDEKGSVKAADISNMSEVEFDKYWNEMKSASAVRPRV